MIVKDKSARRVLFVHNGPLFRNGDGELFGVHFTNEVIERYRVLGDHVTFLMREKPMDECSGKFSRIDATDFSFVSVPDLVNPFSKARHWWEANQVVKSAVENSDVVVARVPSATSTLAIHWSKRLGRPYLVECVACNWDALWNYDWRGKLGAAWYALKQKTLVKQAPYVIYVTEEFLQRRYPTRGEHTNVSDVVLGVIERQVLEIRLSRIDSTIIGAKPITIGTAANIGVPYKGHDNAIRAVALLASRGVDVEYHLIGDGDPTRLKRLADKLGVTSRISFRGPLRHAEVFSALDELDIYIQPSKQEGLPRALIEAMSRGLAAIGSMAGGIPELLPSNRTFKAGDVSRIADLIFELSQPEIARSDAIRNFERTMEFDRSVLDARRRVFFKIFLRESGFNERPQS